MAKVLQGLIVLIALVCVGTLFWAVMVPHAPSLDSDTSAPLPPAQTSRIVEPESLQDQAPAIDPGTVLYYVHAGDASPITITQGEVDQEFRNQGGRGQLSAVQRANLTRQVEEELFQRAALLAEATRRGLIPTPDEIESRIEQIKQNNFPNPELWEQFVKSQGTLDDLQKNLTEDQQINMLVEAWRVDHSSPETEMLEAFYQHNSTRYRRETETTRASHVLIRVDADASAAAAELALASAEAVLDQLRSGVAFEELAQQHSACPTGRQRGGDLGWFAANEMVENFEQAAQALEVGQISNPIRTRFGYHIIKKTGTRSPGLPPLEEIYSEVLRDYQNQMLPTWVEDLKQTVVIRDADGNVVQLD